MDKPQLTEKYFDYFLSGQAFASIVQARQFFAEFSTDSQSKEIEEIIESAVVRTAQRIIQEGNDPLAAFDKILDLYQRQPNLATRTSTSIWQQAYSTPIPIAYLAGVLAGIDGGSKSVYEPTAGNGALLLGSNRQSVFCNELNPNRAEELRQQGYTVTTHDASIYLPDRKFDIVLANPPFGTLNRDGNLQTWVVQGGGNTRPYQTTQIDHAIALNALQAMQDGGRAVLILGAPLSNKTGNQAASSQTYNSRLNRAFYKSLYDNYCVTDHFCISGDLYRRQGTTFPVDVIVIEGRGKSNRLLPAASVPRVLTTFDQLREHLNDYLSRQPLRLVSGDREFDTPELNGSNAGEEPTNPQPTVLPGALDPASRMDDSGATRGRGNGGVILENLSSDRSADEPGANGLGQGNLPELDTRRVSSNPDARTSHHDASVNLPTKARGSPAREGGNVNGANSRGMAEFNAGTLQPITEIEKPMTDQTQVSYQPRSLGKPVGTLTPINMAAAVDKALKNLENRRGQIDAFVAGQLGFNTSDLYNRFSAEQIDALGLAIDNLSSRESFIIGDQTGIGKGRFVAGIIEFTKKQGLIPIFVTQDPKLYADIYRDLADIGVTDLNPLVTNSNLNIPLPNGSRLRTAGLGDHNETLDSIIRTGDMGTYNAVFTTYSQMQSVKAKETIRRDFLKEIAPRSILILDESHNAGGTKKDWGNFEVLDRADFVRLLVSRSAGVVYSSATYAKNPYVMTLYSARTGMRHAVDKEMHLVPMIERGGIPLQQILAAQLTDAGQYIRRERSFEGVEFGVDLVPVNLQLAEDMASVMRGIMEFDEHKRAAVQDLAESLKEEAKSIEKDNAIGRAGVDSTNFTALMHNVLSQSLLALKAEASAQRAMQALEAGEKPVIVLANTMGSFIEETAQDLNLKPGDEIPLTIGDLLNRYLERSRDVLIKDWEGNSTRRQLTDFELNDQAIQAYQKTAALIRRLDWAGVPVSPIDWIHYRLQENGYSSNEITGRTHKIDYGAGVQIYQKRPKDEIGSAGAMVTVNRFNSGTLEVIILNRSGATGISLHASEKFVDQRPRRMIITQAESNIDAFMQALGRVHRTGQVETPRYTFMVGDIPAEKRPAAVLMRKMASLNANTTAARKGDFQLDCVDFMNSYGDRIAYELLVTNLSLNKRLGYPVSGSRCEDFSFQSDSTSPKDEYEGTMAKLTGRIPVLPVQEQEKVYQLLESTYLAKIEEEQSAGTLKLEAQTLDLQAKVLGRIEIMPAREGIDSPFAGPVYVDIIDAKAERLPYTQQDIKGAIYVNLKLSQSTEHEYKPLAVSYAAKQFGRELYEDCLKRTAAFIDGLRREENVERKQYLSRLLLAKSGLLGMVEQNLNDFGIGTTVCLTAPDGRISYGVVKDIWHNIGEGENPLRMSEWRFEIAVASSQRAITIPFSKVNNGTEISYCLAAESDVPGLDLSIFEYFDYQQKNARETRQVFTGNALRAYEHYSGQFINYTLENGQVKQGMIMRHGFNIEHELRQQPVKLPDANRCLAFVERMNRSCSLKTLQGDLVVQPNYPQGIKLFVDTSKKSGGKYYLDEELLLAAGDEFSSINGRMVLDVSASNELAVLEYLYQNNTPLFAADSLEQARDFLGIRLPTVEKAGDYQALLDTLPPVVEVPTSINESAGLILSFERMLQSEILVEIPLEEIINDNPSAKPSEELSEAVDKSVTDEHKGHVPSLQEMRNWVVDARLLEKGEKYIERVKVLAAEMLEGTEQAKLPVVQRYLYFQNPDYELSDKALSAMQQARAESERLRCPTREMLMLWYKASQLQGQGDESLSKIQALGRQQIHGTSEELLQTEQRNKHFKNPAVVLSHAEYREMLASIDWLKQKLESDKTKNSTKVEQKTP